MAALALDVGRVGLTLAVSATGLALFESARAAWVRALFVVSH